MEKILERKGPKSFMTHIVFEEVINGQITINSDTEREKLVTDGHILYHTTTTKLASLKTYNLNEEIIKMTFIDPRVINKVVLSANTEKYDIFDKFDMMDVNDDHESGDQSEKGEKSDNGDKTIVIF